MLARHPDEMVSMAEQTAELTHVLRRTKRRCEQAVTLQPLQPSTIKAIRFRAARDMLDVARIDQGDGESAGLETLKQWNPVHPSGFHGDCGDTTGRSPVSEAMQVTGKGAKFLDRLGIAVGGHTHPMFFSPDINAGSLRMDDGHILRRGVVLLAFFGHTFLQ